MVIQVFTIILCFIFGHSLVCADELCPFATECSCELQAHGAVYVTCDDVSKNFPVFKPANFVVIASLTIVGNFTKVPVRAFYSLQTSIINLLFNRTFESMLPITIESEAFQLANDSLQIYSISFINMLGLDIIPEALRSAPGLTQLSFPNCGIKTLANDSFKEMKINTLNIVNNGLRTIEENAFRGIENSLITLNLKQNELTKIPEAVKILLQLRFMYLPNNRITELLDNSFPSSIYAIYLSFNPLSTIADNAFQNVTELFALEMNNCNLTTIPSQIFQGSFLKVLNLAMKRNQISVVTNKDFSQQFPYMQRMPALDDNPIREIEDGAFSGLVNVNYIAISNLYELKTIDFKIFSSMVRLNHIYLDQFRQLENISVNGMLPSDLHSIEISNVDHIQNLDISFENWLNNSSANVLKLSSNGFRCGDDLQWWSGYVYCSFHPQILMKGSTCDETRIPLEAYVKQFYRKCE